MTVTHREIREAAWNGLTRKLREEGVDRPSKPLVEKKASAEINGAVRDLRAYLSPTDRKAMALAIASSILRHWKKEKARPERKTSRAFRSQLDEAILKELNASGEPAPSIRAVASKLGVSKGRVQRGKAKTMSTTPDGTVSAKVRRLLVVIWANTPHDGRRAIDLRQLKEAVGFTSDEMASMFDAINSGRNSTTILCTDVASCLGSTWVIVQRGRRSTEAQLRSWLDQSERARLAPRRNPLRPDQRRYAIDLEPAIADPVIKDLHAVISIATQSTRSLLAWRAYVNCSLPNSGDIDREAIVTVCQSMVRLTHGDMERALASSANWIAHEATRKSCQDLFSLTQLLIADCDHRSEKEVLDRWIESTRYRQRMDAGELAGRDLRVFDAVMADTVLDDDLAGALRRWEQQVVEPSETATIPSPTDFCVLPSEFRQGEVEAFDDADASDHEYESSLPPAHLTAEGYLIAIDD